uniref:Poly [ADP-ribose] polymerase n=1 Tax=Romanomermis culicivorax TaxID=13658 RepID=A0A915KP70_ROMCU
MIDSCKNWLESRKTPLVQKIDLVIFPGDEDCIQAFNEEYSARLEVDEMTIKKVNIGKLVVDIVYGDWMLQKTDAVVCPVTSEMDIQDSKVTRALAAAIGSKNFEQLMTNCFANYEKYPDNDIIVVESYMTLGASNILFVNASWSEDENSSQVFNDILDAADQMHFKNICIPLLSAGNLTVYVPTIEYVIRLDIIIYPGNEKMGTPDSCVNSNVAKLKCFDARGFGHNPERNDPLSVLKYARKSLDFLPVHTSKFSSPTEESLRLLLYGTEKQVLKAESHLARLCDDNWSQKIIRTNIVEQLGNCEINHLQNEARRINIDLEVYREEKELRIRGPNVEGFINSLRESLKRFVECVNCSNECVKWYRKSDEYPDWTPVEAGVFALESAFKCRNEYLFPLRDFESERNVTVDMKEMAVINETGSIIWTLKRKEKNDNIPLEWDWQPGDDIDDIGYNLVELDQYSKEYEMVRDAALSTDPETYIFKIERVENPVRYQQYALAKERVARNVAPGLPYERMLFHGTSPIHVPAICADCFDRSMAGVNGVLYGQGSYFHKDFAYSYQYGYGKTIFYCNILTGNYCVGNPNIKTAPEFDSKRRIRFDSTVNDATNPDIFVVYSDNHAYPSYLITCD